MNKIFNWTIGSFFRTIGRIIAIGLISILFYSILSKSGFKISDLISIEKVYAAESLSWTTQQSRIYYDQQGTENQTSWQTIPYTQSLSYPATQMQFRLQYSGGLKAGNTYKFKVSYLPSPDSLNASGIWFSDGTNTLTQVNCSGWARESNNYYANICAISPEVDISSSGYLYVRVVFNESYVNSVRSWVGNFDETKGTGAIIQDSAIDIINNQNDNTQSIIQNQIEQFTSLINSQKVCDKVLTYKGFLLNTLLYGSNNIVYFERRSGIRTFIFESSENKTYSFQFKSFNRLRVYESDILYTDSDIPFDVNGTFLLYIDNPIIDNIYQITTTKKYIYFYLSLDSSNTGEIEMIQSCENGAQATTDAINDLKEEIGHSDIGRGQYEEVLNIDVGSDTAFGPFSAFLLIPLTWIQSFLVPSSNCTAINLPLPFMENQVLTLPCMDEFWNNMGAIGTLIELVWIAVVGVRIFHGLFMLVVDTTSSAPNAEELYKIKSWEL